MSANISIRVSADMSVHNLHTCPYTRPRHMDMHMSTHMSIRMSMRRYDEDGDGTISYGEFVAAMEADIHKALQPNPTPFRPMGVV